MATIEVGDEVLEEVKALAKQFLDKSKKDINYAATQEVELLIIGDRITEALFPMEFREHMRRLAEAVSSEPEKGAK